MKKLALLAIALFMLINSNVFSQPGTAIIKPTEILKSNDSFYNYIGLYFFKLTQDIVPLDVASKVIAKKIFLEKLTTGNYLPVKLNSTDGKSYYQLYKVTEKAAKVQLQYIQSYAAIFLDHYKRQGKPFPTFVFTDINGNKYTNANTKGKILVVKCWFIGCQRCEEEMPELNQIVAKYKNHKDVLFVSLALDTKTKLQAFLKRKQFNYKVVAGQNAFISKTLGINAYPTHFVINKKGIIVSVIDNPDEIEYALEHRI